MYFLFVHYVNFAHVEYVVMVEENTAVWRGEDKLRLVYLQGAGRSSRRWAQGRQLFGEVLRRKRVADPSREHSRPMSIRCQSGRQGDEVGGAGGFYSGIYAGHGLALSAGVMMKTSVIRAEVFSRIVAGRQAR